MPTKTELIQSLKLSTQQLKECVDRLGIPFKEGYSDEEARRISDALTNPKSKTSSCDDVEVSGLDFSALTEAQGRISAQLSRSAQALEIAGGLRYLADQAHQALGYQRMAEIHSGAAQPVTAAERQIAEALGQIDDVFTPSLPPGLLIQDGRILFKARIAPQIGGAK